MFPMNEEPKSAGDARAQRPRSPRVPVSFTITMEGSVPGGETFNVQALAVRVSRGGATLVSDAPVSAGTSVRVTPPFGRTLDAEVNGVWTDADDGRQRVGVKLLDPNGWFAE